MQPQQSQAARADSTDLPAHSQTCDGRDDLLSPQATKAVSTQPAGHDAPDSTSTVAWADLQIPKTPSDNPLWGAQSWSPQKGQQQADQEGGLSRSQGRQRNAAGQAGSQTGAVLPSINATPSYHKCRLQHRLSLGASPIDLWTPSTGAVSSVATPTFSELSGVCDLTQS